MHKAGKAFLYIGISLAAIGLFVGFTLMFMGHSEQAKWLIGLVPVGFVLMLAGVVGTQLSGKSD